MAEEKGELVASGPAFRKMSIDELHEDPANVRKHGKKNRDVVRASLQEFGQVEALVVQKGTGRVIGGNCRLAELKALGRTEVWVSEVDVRGVDATRLGLVLNRSAELAEWDSGLADVLTSLAEDQVDMSALGWSDVEVAAMIQDATPEEDFGETDEEAWTGMPEFDQPDKTAFRSIVIHFHDQEGLDDFLEKIGKTVTEKTKYLWFPEIIIDSYADKRYISDDLDGGEGE